MHAPARPAAPRLGAALLPALGALAGLAWFLVLMGPAILDPRRTGWLIEGDLGMAHLGWVLVRSAPWTFPLGLLDTYVHPLGASVAQTDSNPLLALLFKLASPLLPEEFQYLGLWYALCFVLQGVLGDRVVQALGLRGAARLGGTLLFVLSPVLAHRLGHANLCAHWLLLGPLWLYLRPAPTPAAARRVLVGAGAFAVVAALVHPYLAIMVLALCAALAVRLQRDGVLGWRGLAGSLGGHTGAVLVAFWLVGHVGRPIPSGAPGFGGYSADLTALFNSLGVSTLVPSLPVGPGQYEGFGYLGLGVLVLGAGVLVAGWRQRGRAPVAWRPLVPLLVVTAACALFALSSIVTVAGHRVLSLRSFYALLQPLPDALRASGRFIWVAHYVLLAGVVALTWRVARGRPGLAAALLLAAAALQLVDLRSWWQGPGWEAPPGPRLQAPAWAQLRAAGVRHLVLHPPYVSQVVGCGRDDLAPSTLYLLAGLAAREELTLNSGLLARTDHALARRTCEAQLRDVEAGRLRPDALYVVRPAEVAAFTARGRVCGTLDGLTVCASPDAAPFAAALRTP